VTWWRAVEDCSIHVTQRPDKADAFNKYYASVGVADNNILLHITRVSELNVVLDSIDINETDIHFR